MRRSVDGARLADVVACFRRRIEHEAGHGLAGPADDDTAEACQMHVRVSCATAVMVACQTLYAVKQAPKQSEWRRSDSRRTPGRLAVNAWGVKYPPEGRMRSEVAEGTTCANKDVNGKNRSVVACGGRMSQSGTERGCEARG